MPTVKLITAMGAVRDLVGEPQPAAGYYGPTKGIHTIVIRTLNFRGRVQIEASLASQPTDADWFTIQLEGRPYLEFPMARYRRTTEPGWWGDSVTIGYTFSVNANWLRAVVTRDYLLPPNATEQMIQYYGQIDNIMVKY